MKLLLSVAAARDFAVMLLDVKCAFLCGGVRRKVDAELPRQYSRFGDCHVMGKLRKAMHGTRGAPQIWGDMVKKDMIGLGFRAAELHPAVCSHRARRVKFVVHVGGFLGVGSAKGLLSSELKKEHALKKHMLEVDSGQDAQGEGGIEWECDPKSC